MSAVVSSPPSIIALLNSLLFPSVVVGSLVGCVLAYGEIFSGYYLALAVLVFLLSTQFLDDIELFAPWGAREIGRVASAVLINWASVAGIVVFLGYAAKMFDQFDHAVILTWILVTPPLALLCIKLARMTVRHLIRRGNASRQAVVVGANQLGRTFAARLAENPYINVRVTGFFDDRSPGRTGGGVGLLGDLANAPDFVRCNRIDCVYISLPMAAQPRVLQLIEELRDTTASVYFLPDFFAFDLLQARFDYFAGMPVAAIRETPFQGLNAAVKRAMDLVLGTAIILIVTPAMLCIALAVKLDSRGPVFFRQRRYGIDGREIIVRKFRTMTVCEDGDHVEQARRNDSRITRVGGLLRRTSLDELPQFLNVLEGSMSIVGPRPHAVAHNEQYRKLIPGYMLRHKAKPGITGWAQINGFRGETETIEKMEKRVELDLAYLNNWSPTLDLWIIARTLSSVWRDSKAY